MANRPGESVVGENSATNDPKLSDRGARRGSCAAGPRGAGAVTCGAVRLTDLLGLVESQSKCNATQVVLEGEDAGGIIDSDGIEVQFH